MTDLASLVLAVDSTQVKTGTAALDGLTAAGAKAEAATIGLGKGSKTAGAAAAAMAAEAQLASRAAVGMAGGAGTASLAMQSLGTHTKGSALQIRESLVLMREASVGNFTRMAGSASILAGSLATTGTSVTGLANRLLTMVGILKVTQNAELAEAAVQAAASAASVEAYAMRAAGAIAAADTELALAEAAVRVAATSEAAEAAQVKLALAHDAVAAAAAEATIAEDALAVATGRAAGAAAASKVATVTSIGGAGIALAGFAAIAGVAYGAIKQFQNQVKDSGELNKFAEGLRLTDAQIEKAGGSVKYLSDRTREITGLTVTFGDVMYGVWHEIAREISDPGPWNALAKNAATVFDWMLGAWSKVSAGISAGLMSMAHFSFEMAKGGMHGADLSKTDLIGDVQRRYADELKRNQVAFAGIEGAAIDHAKKMLQIESDSNKPPKAPKDKKQSDHGLADALAQLDAQIKGQNALAAAYQVSDAAAIRAEAQQKAEEQAIRHKGEVGIFYEKELALAVASRAADGGKVIADLAAETAARTRVNDAVAAGIIPASQAADALQLEAKWRPVAAAWAVAEGDAKTRLHDIIVALKEAQGDLNGQLAREAALRLVASKGDELEKLKLETQLIGASNRERAVRLAQLEAETFIRDNNIGPDERGGVTQSYVDAAIAANTLTEAQNNYNASLTASLDMLDLIADRTQTVGQIMSDAFGQAGDALGNVLNALATWQAKEQEVADWKRDEMKKAGTDASALANIEVLAQSKSKNAQIQATGALLGGLKGLFKEHSAGYKAMEAAEKAFAIIQAISTIKSVAAGAAKMFSQLGVWAFPAIGAMVAVMAGLGFAGGYSTQKAPGIPTDTQGTGTVLGDPAAKSASIANSLDIMAKNSTKGLDYSQDMVRSLRGIQSGIAQLASSIAREFQGGGAFDASGLGLGTKSSGIQGLFGSKTTTSLYDQGLILNPTNLAAAIANGVSGSTYQIIEKIKTNSGFLGLGGGTKTSYATTYGALDPGLQQQVGLILGSLRDSVIQAAKVLGLDVGAALNTFQVEIGKISFEGMKGDEITQALQAVFSKVADQMAGFAVAGLEQFQKAGEGLFETLSRLAKDYLTIDAGLKSIGKTFGSVGTASIAMREKLIDLAGGLDQFVDQVNYFYDHFLTDSQKTAFLKAQVDTTFKTLGIAVPSSIAAFAKLVTGANLTTDAGQKLFEALMQIAPAFYEVATAADQVAAKAKSNLLDAYKRESSALQQTADKFHKFADSLRDFRNSLFAGSGGSGGYNQALVQLMKQAGLAAGGNEGALGGGLQNSAQSFLGIAEQNARSLQDVERARAMVARYLDQAIGGAEGQATVAEQQLAKMKDQVGKLVDINDSVLSVVDAIKQLTALQFPGSGSASRVPRGTGAGGTGTSHEHNALDRIASRLDDIHAATVTGTVAANKTARILDRSHDGTALRIITDSDAPIQAEVV